MLRAFNKPLLLVAVTISLMGCATGPIAPPSSPFKLNAPKSTASIPLVDARPEANKTTRLTADGFIAGDSLFQPSPVAFVGPALAEAVSSHEWRTLMETWIRGKQLNLLAFEVPVDKGELSVPWQTRYDSMPPGYKALLRADLALAAELRRSKRVAAYVEIEASGHRFVGIGIGPYQAAPSQDAVAQPVADAIRTLVSSIAEQAAGIPRTEEYSQ